MGSKKDKQVKILMDEDLHDQAVKYSEEHGFSLGALVRSLLRRQTDPENPQPPPPGIDKEAERPSRWKRRV